MLQQPMGQDYARAEKYADALRGDTGARHVVAEVFPAGTPLFDQDARGQLYVCDQTGLDALIHDAGNRAVEIQYDADPAQVQA